MPRNPVRPAILAVAALLAVPVLAHGAPPQAVHVLSVPLPDGSVATIRYRGDVPPAVTMRLPPAAAPAAFAPVAFSDAAGPFPAAVDAGFEAPGFAVLDRMQALMRRQAAAMQEQEAAMLRQAAVLDALPAAAGNRVVLVPAALGGAGGCVSGTRITEVGDAAPQVVSFRSAGCGALPPGAVPNPAAIRLPAFRRPVAVPDTVPGAAVPRPESGPRLIEARADQAAPVSLVR